MGRRGPRAAARAGRAELEGAGERSAGGPRGPGERAAGGPAAAPGERGGDGAPSRAAAGASAMFAGLQDLGVANGEDLKETLTNCTEPLKAIEQFQVGGGAPVPEGARARSAPRSERHRPRALAPQTENGVLLPSLQSALPFLDLHGTPRLEFHQSVFDELRDKLLERVSAIASEGKAEERWVGRRGERPPAQRWLPPRPAGPPRPGAAPRVRVCTAAPQPSSLW